MEAGAPYGGAPDRDFLAVHSKTRLPLETSAIFMPQEPKRDDSYTVEDDPLGLVT